MRALHRTFRTILKRNANIRYITSCILDFCLLLYPWMILCVYHLQQSTITNASLQVLGNFHSWWISQATVKRFQVFKICTDAWVWSISESWMSATGECVTVLSVRDMFRVCRLVKVPVIILRDKMSSTLSHALNLLHLTSALPQKGRERKREEERNGGRAQRSTAEHSHQKKEEWEGARELSNGKWRARRVNKKLLNKNENEREVERKMREVLAKRASQTVPF